MKVDSKLRLSCEEFAKTLTESKQFFDRNNEILENTNNPMSEPHPSLINLVEFAKAAYNEMGRNEEHLVYQDNLPSGWELLTTARNDDKFNGYFGASYWNPALQQVVLAHRGTVPTNVGAMWTNVMGVVFKNYSSRISSAATFADRVRCAIDEANKLPGNQWRLSITGHSLGGWLAQITGLSVKHLEAKEGKFAPYDDWREGPHAHVVVFDSPGCKDMLEEIVDSLWVRYGEKPSLESLDISSYLSAPNHINTFGLHVGDIYRVVVNVSQLNAFERHTLMFTLATHKIENFVKAFTNETTTIHEMKDWPSSKIRDSLKLFVNTEYKTFYQKVSHANNYHLDPAECDEGSMEVRYKNNICVTSGSLRMFSKDELKLLNFWPIFKGENVKINKIQCFLTEHNLGEYKKLFEDFCIDNHNRTIICDSKETLEKVITRTKLLMRWFPGELMAAVDLQSRDIPKVIYSMVNRNYLDTLPKYSFNTTDSNELRSFLQSDDRIWQINSEDCDLEMLRLSCIAGHLWEPPLDKYKKDGCQTFLSWINMVNLEQDVDFENLSKNDFTNDNLLVINCASTNISLDHRREQIFKHFFNNVHKKLILVSDHEMPNLDTFLGFSVSIGQYRSFDAKQLTEDSQRKLFNRNIVNIGDKNFSIAHFVGETNFSVFSSKIDSLIDTTDLKNILKNENFVVAIDNSYLNFDVNFSKINGKLNVKKLSEHASSGDVLVISGDRQEEVRKKFAEFNPSPEYRFVWVPEKGLTEEMKFKQTVLDNPNEKVYWIHATDSSTILKQMYHVSFGLKRRFNHRIVLKLEEFLTQSKINDIFIIQNEFSKDNLMSSLKLPEKLESEFMNKENILMAGSDTEDNNILWKKYKKPVHMLKFEETRFLWQRSLGSLEGLRPYVHRDTDHTVGEVELDNLKRKVVIIADEPGTGKSTSLASLSLLLHCNSTNWVIWISLKHFQIPSENVPTEPKERCEFLLRNNIAKDNLSYGLLMFCLHNKHSRQVYLMFDGFDEIKKDYSAKIDTKNEVLKLLCYLSNKTRARIWVTTRLHEKELLENNLSTFAVTLEKISEKQQREYLVRFWYSHLLLESEDCSGETRSKLEECATALYANAKYDLGEDIHNFMGVPLQMRMLAEVFLKQVENYVTSQSNIGSTLKVQSVYSLYENFGIMKYNIYFKIKTGLDIGMSREIFEMNVDNFTKIHRMLALHALFPQFAKQHYKDFESELGETELCRIGLVQSGGNGSGNMEFIHRTLTEYFCAEQTTRWLRKKVRCPGCWAQIVELLLTDILLQESNKVIRIFVNHFLRLQKTSETARENTALQIGKLWNEKQHLLFDIALQTALCVAVEENNERIVDMISSLVSEPGQKSLLSFVAAHNRHGDTALGIASKKAEEESSEVVKKAYFEIMKNLVKHFETWTYEMIQHILLATYIKGHPLKLLDKYLEECPDCSSIKAAFNRTRNIIKEYVPPFLAAVEERRTKDVENLYNQMENEIERHYIRFAPNINGNTALHIAALDIDDKILKVLCNSNIPGIERSYNGQGETPLHCAARAGHLEVVKHFINHGVRINCLNTRRQTALHSAAAEGHLAVVAYLVGKEVDINSADMNDHTALDLAVEEGHLLVVECLIENGVNITFASQSGSTLLHIAAAAGHYHVVKYLVEKGVDVNSADEYGDTALQLAKENGHHLVVDYLLQKSTNIHNDGPVAMSIATHLPLVESNLVKDVDIDSALEKECTAVHRTDGAGPLSVVEDMFEKRVEINNTVKDDRSGLPIAAYNVNLPAIGYLLEEKVDINNADEDNPTGLPIAAYNVNLPAIGYLIEEGVGINNTNEDDPTTFPKTAYHPVVKYLVEEGVDIDSTAEKCCTAVHRPVEMGHHPVVESVFEKKVDINNTEVDDLTTLPKTAYHPVVEHIVEEGVDIDGTSEQCYTAVHRPAKMGHHPVIENVIKKRVYINNAPENCRQLLEAAKMGNLALVKTLIEKGVDINSAAENGDTALHKAVCNRHFNVVEYLVEKGVDINFANKNGGNALHMAAERGHLPMVKYLFAKGMNIDSAAEKGYTALHIAAYNGHTSVMEFLVSKGVNINSAADEGHTALHTAAKAGRLSVLSYLVERRVDINHTTENGDTALHIAAFNGHLQAAEYLVEQGADLGSVTKDGDTVLHKAARSRLPMTKYLVEKGVDITFANKNGCTALHIAADAGYRPVVDYLLEKGINVYSVDKFGETALHKAAAVGHFDVVEDLVEKGGDGTSAIENRSTAMHRAAEEGHLPVVEYLLKKGVDIIFTTKDGRTALHKAAYNGYLHVVEYLVEKEVDINSTDEKGYTALHMAAYKGHLLVAEYLVKKGGNINYVAKKGFTALHKAAEAGHLEMVKYLVGIGININTADEVGCTALQKAAYNRLPSVVEYLVKNGAEINLGDKDGRTALHKAAYNGHLRMVEYLVNEGGNINSISENGDTVLHKAVYNGHLPIVEYLVEKGIDINAAAGNGDTTLHVAACNGHLPVVKYLLEKDVDINSVDKHGRTALHKAAYNGQLPMVEYLFEKKVDVNCADKHGRTALYNAASNGKLQLVKYLLERGADINSADEYGVNALHISASNGHLHVVECLVEKGADINSADKHGSTARVKAFDRNHFPIVEYLVEKGSKG